MKSFLLLVAAFSLIAVAAPAQEGQDNAGNAAYADGLTDGDNGGSGFNAWTISSTNSTVDVTDATTAGGDAVMNTGGRCFRVQSDPGLGSVNASVYRFVSTVGNTSDVLRFDVQATVSGNNIAIVNLYGDTSLIGSIRCDQGEANYITVDGYGSTDTGIPKNTPVRVLYRLLGADIHKVDMRGLSEPAVSFSSGPRGNEYGATVSAIAGLQLFTAFDSGDFSRILLNNLVYDADGDANVMVPVSVSQVLIE